VKVVTIVSMLFVLPSFAQTLSINNASFEKPAAYESSKIDGWHDSNAQESIGGFVMSKKRKDMPDTSHGQQWGELIGQPDNPGDIYQQVGYWKSNSYCTVSLLLGNRAILPDAGLSIELWVGGDRKAAQTGQTLKDIGARRLASVNDISLPENGTATPITRSLPSGKSAKVNEALWIRLVQVGDLQQNAVVLIDNVCVKWTNTPLKQTVVLTAERLIPDVAYTVRDIPVPEGVVVEAGGVCYWPDGTLVVCTRRGEVWTLRDGQWNRFATGLMGALGIWADTVGEVYVTQWPELTCIRDTNGDLSADKYQTVAADWVMPGAKTDFVYGLCRDKQGNFYGTTHTTHGPLSQKTKALPQYSFGGPMGAPFIGRGWSFRVDANGALTWWSSGLRAPNGLAFNDNDALFATDNQGDWVGTSCMHHIEKGDFHGHPSSYQWDPRRKVNMQLPLDKLAVELFKVRKKPAVLFPHSILGNSPSQPALAPASGAFGPFEGQFFVGDNVAPLISRVYLEKVNGSYQGVCFPFMRGSGLKKALCRMTFSPKGKLIIGFGGRGWAPATEGLQEVSWNGKTQFEMQKINIRKDGFDIRFTKALANQDLAKAISIQSYHYNYHSKYGSPKTDVQPEAVRRVSVSADRRVVTLQIPQLKSGKIYAFKLTGVTAADGTTLSNSEAYYTLNQLRGDPVSAVAKKWAFFPICMSHHDSAKRSLDEQATLFKELGFTGCGHLSQEFGYSGFGYPKEVTVQQRAASLEKQGLRLKVAYARIRLNGKQPVDLDKVKALMPTLAKHRSVLGVLLLGDRKNDLDEQAMAILNQLADIAKPHGVEIAIYPHSGDYTETTADSVRIVKKVNRPDQVGMMFNLYHWMNKERDRELKTVLQDARPWLKMVNINGSGESNAQVLPLDQGDFDVSKVLSILDELKYRGPIGLMCWGLGGDARKHLTASKFKWDAMTSVKRRKIVFVGGVDTHGPGAHDHKAGAAFLKTAIDKAKNISEMNIETVLYQDALPDDLSELDDADAVILMWEGWHKHLFNVNTPEVMAKFSELMKRGVGLMSMHAATAVGDEVEQDYLSWAGGNKKKNYSVHPMQEELKAHLVSPKHPIARGVGELRFDYEEFYYKILFNKSGGRITPILKTSPDAGPADDQTIAWAFERKTGGRTFNCTGPHFHKTFQNDDFRKLLLNAILWVAKLDPPMEGVIGHDE
jgi:sugar phosphate isomerase/epimerase/type 1 glutamine amidotransferase